MSKTEQTQRWRTSTSATPDVPFAFDLTREGHHRLSGQMMKVPGRPLPPCPAGRRDSGLAGGEPASGPTSDAIQLSGITVLTRISWTRMPIGSVTV